MPLRTSLLDHLVIATIVSTTFLIFNYSLHRIEEGHVGVYYRVCTYFNPLKQKFYNKINKQIFIFRVEPCYLQPVHQDII